VLWLGPEGEGPSGAWEIAPQCDRKPTEKHAPRHRISAVTGEGLDALRADLVETARAAMPRPGEVALNARQRGLVANAQGALAAIAGTRDPLLVAEDLRIARLAFDALTGRTSTEDVLDALFGRFCIGK
jgi:tRNA modification GTPase